MVPDIICIFTSYILASSLSGGAFIRVLTAFNIWRVSGDWRWHAGFYGGSITSSCKHRSNHPALDNPSVQAT